MVVYVRTRVGAGCGVHERCRVLEGRLQPSYCRRVPRKWVLEGGGSEGLPEAVAGGREGKTCGEASGVGRVSVIGRKTG